MLRALPAAALLLLAACGDGPHENAGEAADARTGAASSEDSIGQGPAERAGQAIDNAIERETEAAENRADAIRNEAQAAAGRLDAQADRLEDQADELRRTAEKAAEMVQGQ